MGTWNVSSFDNDDAQDWLAELDETEGTAFVGETLSVVTDNEDYVEAPEAQQAVAAAEVVAAMRDHPAADLPSEAASWAKQHGSPNPDLVGLARAAVERVRTDSELAELWSEDAPSEWEGYMSDLAARLSR